MTQQPHHHPYLGCRLDLPALRGEVTTVATELAASAELTARERATSWICGSMEESALLLAATLDLSRDERERLVDDLNTATNALFTAEVRQ